MRRSHILVVLLFTLIAWLTADVSAQAPKGTKWALLVGVGSYENPNVTPLRFSVKDVKDFGAALVRYAGFPAAQVVTLTSDTSNPELRPTNDRVVEQLGALALQVKPEDTFVFYFSGHGFVKGNKTFLATVNTNPATLGTLKVSALSSEALGEALGAVPARQRVTIFDCCRNDPESARGAGDNKRTPALTKDLQAVAHAGAAKVAVRATLYACSIGERAHEWPEMQQGVFTHYLLEGLRGKAAEPWGQVTVASLCEYVRKSVPACIYLRQRGKQQTPEFELGGTGLRLVLAKAGGPDLEPEGSKPAAAPGQVQPAPGGGRVAGAVLPLEREGLELVYVPPGEFEMGTSAPEPEGEPDERPAHRVKLTRGFWLAKTEVTNEQYGRFLAANPAYPKPPHWTDPRYNASQQPVTGMSWNDAQAYCRWAGLRLPTEAEWEWAARGPEGRRFPWGGQEPDAARAVFGQEINSGRPAEVGVLPDGKSWCGALDMAGNLWEWVADWYGPYPAEAKQDWKGPETGQFRALRGGSWLDRWNGLRTTDRIWNEPHIRFVNQGFRPARSE